jgi:rhamnulokinase/L-fuculokinase
LAHSVLTFDFGASSGRAVLGSFDGDHIELTEVHRFDNNPVMLRETFYWDAVPRNQTGNYKGARFW